MSARARSESGGAQRRDAGRHDPTSGLPQDHEGRGPDPGDARGLTGPIDRDESPAERADRNFAELVQELRVAQPASRSSSRSSSRCRSSPTSRTPPTTSVSSPEPSSPPRVPRSA